MAPVAKTKSFIPRPSLASLPYTRTSLPDAKPKHAKSQSLDARCSRPTPVDAQIKSKIPTPVTSSFQPTLYDMAFLLPRRQAQRPPAMERAKPTVTPETPQDDLDEFYPDDLELEHSFASNMSLNSPDHSPAALPEEHDSMAMDISPVKPVRRDDGSTRPTLTRPRAFTAMPGARPFGRDLSNNTSASSDATLLEVPDDAVKAYSAGLAKQMARTGMPMQWTTYDPSKEDVLVPTSPADSDMLMDVDTSFQSSSAPEPTSPISTATTATYFHDLSSPANSKLFHDLSSPAGSPTVRPGGNPFAPSVVSTPPASGSRHKKRRSLSPEGSHRDFDQDGSFASPVRPSPAQHKLRRMASGSLLAALCNASSPPAPAPPPVPLHGSGLDPSPLLNVGKRLRRPALNPLAPAAPAADGRHSAYPALPGGDRRAPGLLAFDASQRRAFSARLVPPGTMLPDMSGDESSFDVSVDMSSPAQAVARRAAGRTLRRSDGTDDFRSPGPRSAGVAPVAQDSPRSRYLMPGMPGFGDNEAHGKILPCHRVKEDGLMRINVSTLNSLIDGAFNDRVTEFVVIDCRFEYEYNGGHVPGAININTTQGVEDFFLSKRKPKPSTSADTSRKTVLVFHCEFSAKRAPTFAKHLRSKDRSMNNHCYPRIHYPEVYVLEGGYCQYFKESQARCNPPRYVRMDDPSHAAARKEDLDQFRKGRFGRARSYAYGDAGKLQAGPIQKSRNLAPSGAPPVFAGAARSRHVRAGSSGGLLAVHEDHDGVTEGEDEETDIGDSPCPPPTKGMGSKAKKLGRLPLMRSETCGPLRF